jgi:hypothetical protein
VRKNRDVFWMLLLLFLAATMTPLLAQPLTYPLSSQFPFSFFASMVCMGKGSEHQATALADANSVLEYLTSRHRQLFSGKRIFFIPPQQSSPKPLSFDIPSIVAPLGVDPSDLSGTITARETAASGSSAVDVVVQAEWRDQNGTEREVEVDGSFTLVSPSPSSTPVDRVSSRSTTATPHGVVRFEWGGPRLVSVHCCYHQCHYLQISPFSSPHSVMALRIQRDSLRFLKLPTIRVGPWSSLYRPTG